ncbi:MAG: hypothetical protein ACI9FJ_001150, partial [Alteromonadaceae bacterium]
MNKAVQRTLVLVRNAASYEQSHLLNKAQPSTSRNVGPPICQTTQHIK